MTIALVLCQEIQSLSTVENGFKNLGVRSSFEISYIINRDRVKNTVGK